MKIKSLKSLKEEIRIFLSEWLLSLAFDVAPETEDGVKIKNHIGELFTKVLK